MIKHPKTTPAWYSDYRCSKSSSKKYKLVTTGEFVEVTHTTYEPLDCPDRIYIGDIFIEEYSS